jgi:CRISPR-associated protein Cas2
MNVLLIYDIVHDGTRTKIAELCLDYGLDRIQYSSFEGELRRTHQEELMLKIKKILGKRPGDIRLIPICEKDLAQRLHVRNEDRE